MGDLYDADTLTWSERQAALLRRLAAGERVNADLDWANVIEEVESVGRQAALLRRLAAGERVNEQLDSPNVIEEIESVGKSELRVVRSALVQAMRHDLKARAKPDSLAVPNWRAETRQFRQEAEHDFTESMRQHLDLSELYCDAAAGLPDTIDGKPPLPIPAECALTLDEFVRNDGGR